MRKLIVVSVAMACAIAVTHAQRGRPLALEDYYRVQNVSTPEISPDGRSVIFNVATRIEQDNSTRTEVMISPADGSGAPRRVVHYGRDITDPSWANDGRLQYTVERQRWSVDPTNAAAVPAPYTPLPNGAVASADQKWIALTRDKPQPRPAAATSSEFEKRHEERFKGVQFDWKDFQRDGQPFPAPNLRARPAQQLVVQPIGGGDPKVLVDRDFRPSGVVWYPRGSLLAFTAYIWLLHNAPISTVATYAFVNPVVAVLLGWWLLSEELTVTMLVAAVVIVASVALVVRTERYGEPTPADVH